MIRMNQMKLEVSHSKADLKRKILKTLRIKEEWLLSYSVKKQSLDARKKPVLYYVYTVDVRVKNEASVKKRIRDKNILFQPEEKPYKLCVSGTRPLNFRPVIIGTGPAGLFCGVALARLGYRPILLERGAMVGERLKDVEAFWNGGSLKPNSNVQFGEGGAGTFSDGKLNTLVHDVLGRGAKVLELFVEHGAPEEILYQSKPHIGTDILAKVVKNMRSTILSNGGEVRFHSQVTDVIISQTADRPVIRGLRVRDDSAAKEYVLETEVSVLAIGHSARDTFAMLAEKGVPMEAKSFAVGVRIEHPQDMINRIQYGNGCPQSMPPAAYKLASKLPNKRGVYTFCMCPGGYVVNASSEPEGLSINGMSYHGRAGSNANSAVIVTVTPKDYEMEGALCGIEFQRRLERAAYRQGSGGIPVQTFKDFCEGRASEGPGEILPQMKGAYAWGNVRNIFPEELAVAIEEGIRSFEQKIKGFARPDALVSGVESRTSSPVRILRDESLQSRIAGLYPCGEGAGYAGGITSAAIDGLKVAESIVRNYRSFDRHTEGLRNF